MMEVRTALYLEKLPPVESLDALPASLQEFFPAITNYLHTLRAAIAKAEQLQRASASTRPERP